MYYVSMITTTLPIEAPEIQALAAKHALARTAEENAKLAEAIHSTATAAPLPEIRGGSIELDFVKLADTGKAIRIARNYDHGGEAWLPSSQIRYREVGYGSHRGKNGRLVRVVIPAWLYNKIRTTI